MQAFHIYYRNTQGTLMRILNAVSRRALDMPYVQAQAEPIGELHKVTLLLEVSPKQAGQLRRDWYAIVDVTEVHSSAVQDIADLDSIWSASPHPPSSAVGPSSEAVRAARA
jgi:acetolactate synthase small subunit